jgi:hypothetical protein
MRRIDRLAGTGDMKVIEYPFDDRWFLIPAMTRHLATDSLGLPDWPEHCRPSEPEGYECD